MFKKCIFCNEISENSKSVEHIIPESLGNTKYIMPKGLVCDKCNNYFSSHIERQFLEIDSIKRIRFQTLTKNKKGKIPKTDCLVCGDIAELSIINGTAFIGVEPETLIKFFAKKPEKIITKSHSINDLENSYDVSRMLLKIAYELFVYLGINKNDSREEAESLEFDGENLEPARKYIRYGRKDKQIWPYSVEKLVKFNNKDGVDLSCSFKVTDDSLMFIFILYFYKFEIKLYDF